MTSWRLNAACVGVDPEVFFTNTAAAKRKAKRICLGCPVREDCLTFVMEVEQPEPDEAPETNFKKRNGIYGGLTAYTRWELEYPDAAAEKRKTAAARRRLDKMKAGANDLCLVP